MHIPPPPLDRAAAEAAVAQEKLRKVREETSLAKGAISDTISSLMEELERRRLKSLKEFIHSAWHIVEPDQDLRWNWHLDRLCSLFERVYDGEVKNVVINIPPGCMKSLMLVFFRAWTWSRNPALRFLNGSYGGHLSTRDNVKLRSILLSPWYRTTFPHVSLAGDQNAKERFETTSSGWSIATSVGGIGTGEHPDFVIVDDPITEQQSRSATERETAITWLDGTLSTRGRARGARFILVMQRFHEDDPSGHLLRTRKNVEHVCFPMRFEEKYASSYDSRTVDGELLWPALFPEGTVKDLETTLGVYGSAGQLQQRPVPLSGGMLKSEWLRRWHPRSSCGALCSACLPDTFDEVVQSWDCAFKSGAANSYVVGQVWGRKGSLAYLLDQRRGHWDLPGTLREILFACSQYPQASTKLIEDKANGPAVLQMLTGKVSGLIAVTAKDSKEARVAAVSPFFEAGNILIPHHAPWLDDYVKELITFPNSAHDDQVDSTTQAVWRLLGGNAVTFENLRLGAADSEFGVFVSGPSNSFDNIYGNWS